MANDVEWETMVVAEEEFREMRELVEATDHPYRINWLSHETLDKLYVMVFPDGTLTVPVGSEFRNYGPFLEVDDMDALLDVAEFDRNKHQRHSQGWSRT